MNMRMGVRPVLILALVAVSALVLNACGIGIESSDETKAQELRDSKAISDRYNLVKGVYDGVISNESTGLKPMNARLSLYVIYLQDGKHSDGTPKMRPELRGRFRLVDALSETDGLTLSGDYSEFGDVKLSSLTAAAGAGGGAAGGTGEFYQLSLMGRIDGGTIKLEVSRSKGAWGTFEGKQTSNEASAPAAGDTEELRQRLLEIYKRVAGAYQGVVITEKPSQKVPGGSVEAERYPVELRLIMVEYPSGDGSSLPGLVGHYRMLAEYPGVGERSLSVEYNSITGDITMKNAVSNTGIPGYEIFSITAKVGGGKLNGTLVDKNGPHVLKSSKL